MARFGKYKVAEVQTGMGAFPSAPSNITQNNSPVIDREIGVSNNANPNNGINQEPQVLTREEIYNILKSNKA